MKRIFLIDYENVSDSGLDGFFDLTPEDTVYLFYTVNACKIGIDFVDLLRKQSEGAALRFLRAATGNQALDFQLSSFLGGLIAENPEKDTAFFIISKDRGYSCLPGFWSAMRPGVRVSILPRISEETKKRQKAPAPAVELQPKAETPPLLPEGPAAQPESSSEAAAVPPEAKAEAVPAAASAEEASVPAEVKPAPNAEAAEQKSAPAAIPHIEEKPVEAKPLPAVTPQPEAAKEKPAEAKPLPAAVPQTEAAKEKPAEAKPVPAAVPQPVPVKEKAAAAKPIAEKAAEPKSDGKKALPPADRAALNSAVQQLLSKARCEPQISNATASLVTKMYKDGTNKQELYRGIIKSFGQKQGLEVYNLIKPILM